MVRLEIVDTEGIDLARNKHMMMNPIKNINQCLRELQEFFPGRSLSEIRSEVVANETFGTKLYNGTDPFWKKISEAYTPHREDHADAKAVDRFVEIVNQMTTAILWNQYKIIYTLDPDLADALLKTKKLHFTKEIFSQIPYKGFYINLSLLPEYQAEGCLVIVSKNRNSSNMILLDIQLVGAKDFEEGDGTYELLVFASINGRDGIRNNRTVTEGIFFDDKDGIFMIDTDEFIERKVKGKQALLKKTRAGYSINQENPYLFLPIRKRMLSLSLLVLQFLMYISSDKPDVELSRETKRQKNRLQRLNKQSSFNEPEKWNVGVRYGEKIRLYKKQYEDIPDDTERVERGHHKPPRPHLRRAHWQYYWTGEGRKIQKHVWVEPTLVNSSNDNVPITLIDVTNKETKGYDGENHVKDYLEAKKIKYKPQYNVKSINKKYDFCAIYHNKRLMIEFDGEQHFKPVEYWGGEAGFLKQKEADLIKTNWCEKEQIPLLRIRFDQKPYISEMIEDFLCDPLKYVKNHNTYWSNEEYYSIRS